MNATIYGKNNIVYYFKVFIFINHYNILQYTDYELKILFFWKYDHFVIGLLRINIKYTWRDVRMLSLE